MTNTKWLSALLAGTALVAVGTAAKADDLSTLKAQLEALQAQVASLQASPAMPAGASLLTVKRNAAGEGVTFAVAPTADMPAPATEVTIKGEVRSTVQHYSEGTDWNSTSDGTVTSSGDSSWSGTDISSRIRVYIDGKTETSVGEVGVHGRVQTSNGGTASFNDYYGYWAISDSLKLTGGHSDTIAAVAGGADWNGTGGVWNGSGMGLTDPGVDFAKLTFTTGPITADVGVETNIDGNTDGQDDLAYAGSLTFAATEALSLQVTARTEDNGDESNDMVGASANFSMDRVTVSLGAAKGNGGSEDWTYLYAGNTDMGGNATGWDWTAYSGLVTVALAEDLSVEAFAGRADNSNNGDNTYGGGAGLFWSPVKQLKLGVGADYFKSDASDAITDEADQTYDVTTVGVGAWFKF